jgi:hypothetical protein
VTRTDFDGIARIGAAEYIGGFSGKSPSSAVEHNA